MLTFSQVTSHRKSPFTTTAPTMYHLIHFLFCVNLCEGTYNITSSKSSLISFQIPTQISLWLISDSLLLVQTMTSFFFSLQLWVFWFWHVRASLFKFKGHPTISFKDPTISQPSDDWCFGKSVSGLSLLFLHCYQRYSSICFCIPWLFLLKWLLWRKLISSHEWL